MIIFYQLALGFYWLIIRLISPFHDKARQFSEGRKNWESKLTSYMAVNSDPVIWMHCASLGEFEQGRPIIEKLREQSPDHKILLTFFSPSGYEIRKNYEMATWVMYLPIDSPRNARYFMETVKPSLALFIKYEYWYCFIRELNARSIPIFMISAIFRENQFFFHRLGGFYRKALRWIDYFFVQDQQSLKLINSLGITDAEVSGDTRFDRVLDIAEAARDIPEISEFKGSDQLIVVGSAWSSDLEVMSHFLMNVTDDFKVVIAPHNIQEFDIRSIESMFPDSIRFSKYDRNFSGRVMIIDNMGMLSSIYRYGEFALIGGAFRGALHNTLEAAVYGIPVLFGAHANNEKFNEAMGLINSGGAFTFESSSDLHLTFEILQDDQHYLKACKASLDYVKLRSGATEMVISKIKEALK